MIYCLLQIISEYNDDYRQLKFSNPKEYYVGLRREWSFRVHEAENLVLQLRELGSHIVRR